MGTMTLEQISSSIHNAITDTRGLTIQAASEWADAIDAAISARGEAVYQAYSNELNAWQDLFTKSEYDAEPIGARRILYRTPPVPQVDEAMCWRAARSKYEEQDAGGYIEEMRAALTAVLQENK